MGKHALNAATVYIGATSVDLSDFVESIEFTVGVGSAAFTAMQDGWEDHLPNQVKRWSVRLSMYQSYDSSETYQVLQTALSSSTSTVFPMFAKATTEACSATNPGFTGNVVFDGDFAQIAGAVGDAHKFSVSLKGAGTLSFITSATA